MGGRPAALIRGTRSRHQPAITGLVPGSSHVRLTLGRVPMEGESVEDKETAIIRVVYASGSTYSHAERVMHRLQHLKREMPHREAIEVLHAEVVDRSSD